MDSLSIILENCYGIGTFNGTFDFSESNSNLIYAPNGVMKTSLARTFLRLSEGKKPEDLVFKRESSFDIKINGVDIAKEDILVIEPFDPEFESQNISTLLVNKEKKAVYDKIYKDIITAKKKLIAELNKVSKVPREKLEETMISDIGSSDFFEAIRFLQKSGLGNTNYSQLVYLKIFDPKVLALLAEDNIKAGIVDYTARYNELIKSSPLFMQSGFNPVKADTVLASLKKEMFFEAQHKLLLNGKSDPISNHADLEKMFEKEKEEILGDGNLKAISQKISKGVVSVKSFQDILETHPEISAELNDLDNFKKVIWSSYYLANRELFDLLLSLFDKGKAELATIEAEAQTEKTLWHEAKRVFKERFHIDFSIDIENQTNAILGTDEPNIVFTFNNNNNNGDEPKIKFNRGQLNSLDFLSVGERRAMYLLYVIFEFKARKARGKSTLIIIDDIADSFDYKNKYAIIEYLKELSDDGLFGLLVLTHNFDFYRTFQSRILGERHKRKHSFIAQKESGNISLLGGGDNFITSPFDYWKNNFGENKQIIVSMIPFVRNLVEYKDGKRGDNYSNLTSLLHMKPNTKTFTLSCLEKIISSTIKGLKLSENIDKTLLVIDFIYDTAELVIQNLNNSADEIRLENKVALSIAIRLKAEEFMLSKVIDQTKIDGPQTGVLFDRLSNENKDKGVEFKMVKSVLSQVVLMTPENIHINSFMYEPLMDMSNHHLISLYKDIKKLEWDGT